MSAAESESEACSAEQANECVVQANEQTEERMAQYSMRRLFYSLYPMCNGFTELKTESQAIYIDANSITMFFFSMDGRFPFLTFFVD